jgi:hypothetical protein
MPKPRAMPRWMDKELRTNFARASRAGRRAAKSEPRAAYARYSGREHALRIALTNGATVKLPVKLIPQLRRAARHDVRTVEILGRGGGLHWERLDLDLSVPGLLSSMFARTRVASGARPHRRTKILCRESRGSAQKRAERRPAADAVILVVFTLSIHTDKLAIGPQQLACLRAQRHRDEWSS